MYPWDRRKKKKVAQSCPTLCNPMDCSLPSSSIHGIFQVRILEWVAISFSRRSSRPRDWTRVSRIVGRCFTIWATIAKVWDSVTTWIRSIERALHHVVLLDLPSKTGSNFTVSLGKYYSSFIEGQKPIFLRVKFLLWSKSGFPWSYFWNIFMWAYDCEPAEPCKTERETQTLNSCLVSS